MNTHYKVRNFFVLIILVWGTMGTTYAQSKPPSHLSSKIQVQKELSSDKFSLVFKNRIGAHKTNFEQFENMVNHVGFKRLVSMGIDSKSNNIIADFKLNAREKSLGIFFAPAGYNDFVIIQ